MIWRYVSLKFQPEQVDTFLALYQSVEEQIRNQPGCVSLMLLRDTADPTAFATWSRWSDRRLLQDYRRSEFFRSFWPQVKQLLRDAPVAASYDEVDSRGAPISAHLQ